MAGPLTVLSEATPRILIAGGTGVFGRLLARELLARTDAALLIAARDRRRAAALCRALRAPARVEPLALDLARPDCLGEAAAGCTAVACAAGPFQALPRSLPVAAVAAGAHWLDIADDPGWLLPLLADRRLDAMAKAAGLVVMPGLSTTPALSGVLVRWCRRRLPGGRRARLTLVIGNRNAKGASAIASLLGAHPRDPRRLWLPAGRHLAYRFETADAALLRDELGVAAEFRVAFEWDAAGRVVAALASLGARLGPAGRLRLARGLALLARPFGRVGSALGYLHAELRDDGGRRAGATLGGAGQRLAILPCALALEALLTGELSQRGVLPPAAWLPVDAWLARLRACNVSLSASPLLPSSPASAGAGGAVNEGGTLRRRLVERRWHADADEHRP